MTDEDPFGPHPSSEKLSAYHANELPPEEDDAIQEHVADCRLCAERLLELQQFLEPAAVEREGVADFETAAEWRWLGRRIADSPAQRFFRSLKTAYSIAAILVIGLVGLTAYTASLLEELQEPVADLELQTLEARGSRRGGNQQDAAIRLPRSVALDVPSRHDFPSYRLIFREQHGRIVHSMPENAEGGFITFFLPRRFLSPGDYEIEMLGLQGRTSESLGVFDLYIRD